MGSPISLQPGTSLAELVNFCKDELQLPFVSVQSNGSLITRDWLLAHGKKLTLLGLSCDSFDEATNALIGRRATAAASLHTSPSPPAAAGGGQAARVQMVAEWSERCWAFLRRRARRPQS